jgi:hypothetical protein
MRIGEDEPNFLGTTIRMAILFAPSLTAIPHIDAISKSFDSTMLSLAPTFEGSKSGSSGQILHRHANLLEGHE